MNRILLVIAAAAMLLMSGCRFENQRHSSSSPVKDSLLVEYMRYASQFSDCSYVDWDRLSKMRIMQNTADWDESLNDRIHSSWKQENLAAGAWAILQNAKAELHRRSIPVRAVSSRALCRRMDALEKSFDKAFELMVTQEYYLRCFEDVFDETVPPMVEGLYK
ncbi:MAG: hypothetical protein IKU36_01510 [Bacteroidales bacterium]|nr:hypothetical protein [Bacteroidales bacterium]